MSTSLIGEYPNYPSHETIRQQLNEQAYAQIPFELGRAACNQLFDDFSNFIDLCFDDKNDRLKKSLEYRVHDMRNGAYHLEYRQPGDINANEPGSAAGTDHKYIFHYGPQTISRAKTTLGGSLPTEMAVFLDNCDEFYEAGKKVLRFGATALHLDKVMFSPVREEDVHILRLIDYLESGSQTIGEPHFDRSMLTGALFSNTEGLRGVAGQNGYLKPISERYINNLQKKLKPIYQNEFEANFFAGAGLNHLPPHLQKLVSDIPLMAHDIVNGNSGQRRQSGVMFGNPTQRFVGYTVPEPFETGFSDIKEHIRQTAA